MVSQVSIYMMDIVSICVEVFISCFCVKVKVQWRIRCFYKASLRISRTCLFQSKGSWILKDNSLKLTYSLKLVSAIFFVNFLFFHQTMALQKLWRLFFISSKNLFFFSRCSNFCISFPSCQHLPDPNEQIKVD